MPLFINNIKKFIILACSFFFMGCISDHLSPYLLRGKFTVVVPAGKENTHVSHDRKKYVTGKACFKSYGSSVKNDIVFENAVKDALKGYPEEYVLSDAIFIDKGMCILVKGYPMKLEDKIEK